MVHPQERPRGAIDDESEALPGRFIGQSLAGFGDGIGIDGVTYVARFALFQMLGKVQHPLAGDSSTAARGHRRRRRPSARRRRIRAEMASLKGDQLVAARSRSRTRYAPSRPRPGLRHCSGGRLHIRRTCSLWLNQGPYVGSPTSGVGCHDDDGPREGVVAPAPRLIEDVPSVSAVDSGWPVPQSGSRPSVAGPSHVRGPARAEVLGYRLGTFSGRQGGTGRAGHPSLELRASQIQDVTQRNLLRADRSDRPLTRLLSP